MAHAVPTVAGVTALLLLLLAVALWATGGNNSMSYYQREVIRAMRKQSRQEKTNLAADAHPARPRHWAGRVGRAITRKNKPNK